MNICVLLPSEQQKEQAGVRIRYQRISTFLINLGHQLELLPIQLLTLEEITKHDVFLISKCYDARAFIAAECIMQNGKKVGVDLFDDYFSQMEDSRFVRLRYWLRTLIDQSSFILCSTPKMKELAKQYAPHLPIHIMNDPADQFDNNRILETVHKKIKYVQQTRQLNVAWFGMGDNPNFSVGLSDLIAFSDELAGLRGYGYHVRLEILTNRRALTPENLSRLHTLAVPYTIDEWSEAGEKELLSRNLLCFLPVNAQNFSTVKSLNRAVTALTSGTQILSVGYPLYEAFAPFVYRNAAEFMDDLMAGTLRFSEQTRSEWISALNKLADIGHEATALVDFLSNLVNSRNTSSTSNMTAVVHGKETLGDIHKYAQQMGGLSIASPFTVAALNYDLRFVYSSDGLGLDMLISKKKESLLDVSIQRELESYGSILSTEYKILNISRLFPDIEIVGIALAKSGSQCSLTAVYPSIMSVICEIVERLFPKITFFHAEQSKTLPWHVDVHKNTNNKKMRDQ